MSSILPFKKYRLEPIKEHRSPKQTTSRRRDAIYKRESDMFKELQRFSKYAPLIKKAREESAREDILLRADLDDQQKLSLMTAPLTTRLTSYAPITPSPQRHPDPVPLTEEDIFRMLTDPIFQRSLASTIQKSRLPEQQSLAISTTTTTAVPNSKNRRISPKDLPTKSLGKPYPTRFVALVAQLDSVAVGKDSSLVLGGRPFPGTDIKKIMGWIYKERGSRVRPPFGAVELLRHLFIEKGLPRKLITRAIKRRYIFPHI